MNFDKKIPPLEQQRLNNNLSHFADVGNINEVSYYIWNGAEVNSKDNHGDTPLHIAARKGHLNVVEKLIVSKAEVDSKNNNGETPLHIAACQGHLLVVEKLIASKKANVNAQDKHHDTPLHMAAREGHLTVVEKLIDEEVDVNAKNNFNKTPLHKAARKGHLTIVTKLIDKGADVNAQDIDGETPLHIAAWENKLTVVEKLIENGAYFNARSFKQYTPLKLAKESGHTEVKAFLEKIEKLFDKLKKNELTENDLQEIQNLISENKNYLDARDYLGNTLLHYAIEKNYLNLAIELIKEGASTDIKNRDGDTPLEKFIEKLIDKTSLVLKEDAAFKASIQGEKGLSGDRGPAGLPGQDANPEDVAKELQKNEAFINSVKGPKGDPGARGESGQDAKPEEVAAKLIQNSQDVIVNSVANNLKEDSNFQKKIIGPPGPIGTKGNKGDSGARGKQGSQGAPGQDAKPETVATKLKDDIKFINSVKGQQGIQGPPGAKGEDANPEDVAKALQKNEAFINSVKGSKGNPGPEGKRGEQGIQGPAGAQGLPGQDAKPETVATKLIENQVAKGLIVDSVATNQDLQTGVASKLKTDNDFQGKVKGDTGPQGPVGPKGNNGDPGARGESGQDANPEEVASKLIQNSKDVIVNSVASKLKIDNDFQGKVKGDTGPQGPVGPKGDKGDSGLAGAPGQDAKPEEVASKLIAQSKDFIVNSVATNQDLQTGVASKLKTDNDFQGKVKGNTGPQGPVGPKGDKGDSGLEGKQGSQREMSPESKSGKDTNMSSFKIVKEKSYGEISSAKIVDGENDVCTLSDTGYFFQSDELYIRNHLTDKNIRVPQEFYFLKAIHDSSGRLKFALCNSSGNLLYEYKKYDSEYVQLPKFVEVSHLSLKKGEVLNKYHRFDTWGPVLQLKKNPSGEVDVCEITQEEKKIGKLINEFVYYEGDKLHYKNYHNPAKNEFCYGEDLYVNRNNMSIKKEDGYNNNDSTVNLEQSFDVPETIFWMMSTIL